MIHPRPGWPLAVAASVLLLVVQQADVLFISPRTVTRRIRLHPVTIMLSLLVAGTIAGVYGMLLAIPTIAAVKILVVHYWDTRMVWPPPGPEDEVADRFDGPVVPGDPVTAGPDTDPGPAMVAVLPEDDPADGRARPRSRGRRLVRAADGDANGSGNGEPARGSALAFSPGRVARAWRQGRTPEGKGTPGASERRAGPAAAGAERFYGPGPSRASTTSATPSPAGRSVTNALSRSRARVAAASAPFATMKTAPTSEAASRSDGESPTAAVSSRARPWRSRWRAMAGALPTPLGTA